MPLYVKGSSLQEKCFKLLEKRKHLGKSLIASKAIVMASANSQLSQLFLNMFCLMKSVEILFLISNLQRK